MYERNAIIIERYYNNMFGYDLKHNIKENFKNYCELIDAIEKYKNISEEEEEIIIEYDIIANKIRDIQKKQENYNKKNLQYQQERNNIFQNIDEDANLIQKSLDKVNNSISDIDEDIKENALNFINVVAEFNEKSLVRVKCGKSRRIIEKEYNKKLNETLENYKNIDINLEKRAKQFIERDTAEIEAELKNKIQKNGEKEKIPFKNEVIDQAIILSIDIQKRETDILSNVYEKTNKLFSEIKNNTIKIEKHKKLILDSKCKLEMIAAIKEYMVQFLDNERLSAVNGENEYDKLMDEACHNLNEDLIQINNLYSLLIKEISKKATKKAYTDLYNIEYLKKLENKAEEFDSQVKKLKLPVAVINPNHWRIEGMKRIYDIFNKTIIENYNTSFKEFIPIENNNSDDEEYNDEIKYTNQNIEHMEDEFIYENQDYINQSSEAKDDEDELKNEIDKKIDMILGFRDDDDEIEKSNQEDDWDENDDEDFKDDLDSKNEDRWEDDDFDEEWDDEEVEEDWNDEEVEEDWNDEEIFEQDEFHDTQENEEDEDYDIHLEELRDDYRTEGAFYNKEQIDFGEEDFDDEIDYDIWGNNITRYRNSKQHKDKEDKNDWENEFINIGKKDKNKKKGFFDKFKR